MHLQAVGGLRHILSLPPASASGQCPYTCPSCPGSLPRPSSPGHEDVGASHSVLCSGCDGAALAGPCADCVPAGSCPETGGPELAYSGDTHTPSLSSASVTSPCSEFWDTEVIWLFLNVFCFWTENNFADVTFGGKGGREREFQTKPRMI